MDKARRTLLIEPYDYVRARFDGDERVAIYAEKSILCRDEGQERTFDVVHPESTQALLSDIDIDSVKSRIRASMPLFYRWMGESDTYEDSQRSFLIFVLRLTEVLRTLGVAQAIFFTGVAHHVEYALIEIACQFAGVRQVFLYPMPFGPHGRLLPVIQDQSIGDRRPLGLELSAVEFREDVVAYRDNYLAHRVPKQNERIGGPSVSRSYAYLKLLEREARRWTKSIIGRARAQSHLIDRHNGYGFTAMARIIGRQKQALDYYSTEAISNEDAERLIRAGSPLPLLYAHYQPEASTFPEGGSFSDHLDVVLAMRKTGYSGPILYKEHPASSIYYSNITGFSLVGIARSHEYYLQLEALGCVFLQPRFRPDDRMLGQIFPVTITGSIAVERSVTGWKTCCAGQPWFKDAPGIVDIAACFGPGGIFYKPARWRMDENAGISWFSETLSRKTMANYPGIGTGRGSSTETDRLEFLDDIGLIVGLHSGARDPHDSHGGPMDVVTR